MTLHRIRQMVSGVQDIQEQVDLLARELPGLGIQQCSMALYLDPAQPLEGARLVLGFDETRRRSQREGEIFRPAWRLLSTWPEGNEPSNFMVYPLYFRNEQLGFILLDADDIPGNHSPGAVRTNQQRLEERAADRTEPAVIPPGA